MKGCLREGAIQEFWRGDEEYLYFMGHIQFTTLSTENRSIIWKFIWKYKF